MDSRRYIMLSTKLNNPGVSGVYWSTLSNEDKDFLLKVAPESRIEQWGIYDTKQQKIDFVTQTLSILAQDKTGRDMNIEEVDSYFMSYHQTNIETIINHHTLP